jgi:motility quorum-sensing regulator / GCU-specific mRNA interferase toxin
MAKDPRTKLKPHYDLATIQKIVADPNSRPFTVTALQNGLALGLREPEMRQVVMDLSRKNFYKSMGSKGDSAVWQDVYHGITKAGVAVYIKISLGSVKPVIQFKAKDEV